MNHASLIMHVQYDFGMAHVSFYTPEIQTRTDVTFCSPQNTEKARVLSGNACLAGHARSSLHNFFFFF